MATFLYRAGHITVSKTNNERSLIFMGLEDNGKAKNLVNFFENNNVDKEVSAAENGVLYKNVNPWVYFTNIKREPSNRVNIGLYFGNDAPIYDSENRTWSVNDESKLFIGQITDVIKLFPEIDKILEEKTRLNYTDLIEAHETMGFVLSELIGTFKMDDK